MDDGAQIEQRLADAHEAKRRQRTLTERCAHADRAATDARAELEGALRLARVQGSELAELESLSGAHIWSVLKGSHGSDIERAAARASATVGLAVTAKARYERAIAQAETARRDLAALGDVDAQLGAVRAAKEKYLTATTSPKAAQLLQLASERGRLTAEAVELNQAIAAGESALAALDLLAGELASASGWSTWDTYFRGGLISTSFKHSHMDAAAALSARVDEALATFGRELADVTTPAGTGVAATLAMSKGTRLIDGWLDNIVTDWSVGRQIGAARGQEATVRAQVVSRVADCRRQRDAVIGRLRAAEAERLSLLG